MQVILLKKLDIFKCCPNYIFLNEQIYTKYIILTLLLTILSLFLEEIKN